MLTAPHMIQHVFRVLTALSLVTVTSLVVSGADRTVLPDVQTEAPPPADEAGADDGGDDGGVVDGPPACGERLWVISSRHLTSVACRAKLEEPQLRVSRLSTCGRTEPSTLDEYFASLSPDRVVVIYAHGNRLNGSQAIRRFQTIYRSIHCRLGDTPVDWVVFSWPAEKTGMLIRDFRDKARRCDAQGLYLAWLLKRHQQTAQPTTLIGYSFGGRVVTGALHAMAGGKLAGRRLPSAPTVGAGFTAGLVAPALESNWMSHRGYHGQATKNLEQFLLLYNRRDAVLKRYWLLDQMRGSFALGYTGPRTFGPRADGTKLIVRARDCASFIGIQHDEIDYYQSRCSAGAEMAKLIHDTSLSRTSDQQQDSQQIAIK